MAGITVWSVSLSRSFLMLASAQYVKSCAVSLACCHAVTRSVSDVSRAALVTFLTLAGFLVLLNVHFVVRCIHSRPKDFVHCQPTNCCQEYWTSYLSLVCLQPYFTSCVNFHSRIFPAGSVLFFSLPSR